VNTSAKRNRWGGIAALLQVTGKGHVVAPHGEPVRGNRWNRRGRYDCDGKAKRIPKPGLLLRYLLLAGILIMNGSVKADILGLDAVWRASELGSDSEEDNISAYNQRYFLRWNPQVTRAISLNADMNYSRNWVSNQGTRENINPTLDVSLQNYLFEMQFNGNVNQTNSSVSPDRTGQTWEAVLASTWEYQYWPSLSMTFGQNRVSDSREVRGTDLGNDWFDFNAKWALGKLAAYYMYELQDYNDYA